MYGEYLTEKVQAKRAGEELEKLVLDSHTYRSFRRDRLVRDSHAEDAPIRFGLVGDFSVVEGDENVLVTDEGERHLE